MAQVASLLTPNEAIDAGFRLFQELFANDHKDRVLLEGLHLDEKAGSWVVTFGFDSQRVKPQATSQMEQLTGGALAAIYRRQEPEILREFRAVHLSASDGKFIKLEHA